MSDRLNTTTSTHCRTLETEADRFQNFSGFSETPNPKIWSTDNYLKHDSNRQALNCFFLEYYVYVHPAFVRFQ